MTTPLEEILITSYKEEMISFLNSQPEYFNEAIELAISNKQPFSWRAAWLLWSCMEENDKRVKKYIKEIVESIKFRKDGHQRQLLKILFRMKLNSKYEGIVFNICMDIWEQIGKDPSVRITALKFIINIASKHTNLLKEIVFLTEDHYLETLSPGIKNSVERMIAEIKNSTNYRNL